MLLRELALQGLRKDSVLLQENPISISCIRLKRKTTIGDEPKLQLKSVIIFTLDLYIFPLFFFTNIYLS
jgi:hypothetical protein